MIDKNLANEVLALALSKGGDFSEIFIEQTRSSGISMINGVLEKSSLNIICGCGIRVYKGFGAIYATTNDLSRDGLLKIAREIAAAISEKSSATVLNFEKKSYDQIVSAKILPKDVKKSEVASLLRLASETAFNFDKSISQTSNSYADVCSDILIANSNGVFSEDKRVRTRVSVSSVASSASEKQSGVFSPGASMGYEFIETVDFKKLGEESAKVAVTMLNGDLCPSGEMPVVIENGFGGVIFHEACGHSLEATAVAKNASVFCGKLGQKIASDKVSALDDGTINNSWGSINMDDEGNKSQKNLLIENGILKSYLVDDLNGRKMNMKPTGSSRRQSYKFAPTSRMTNTYIASGNDKWDDIIKSTEYGIYAKKMGGGSVSPATGEFNFHVAESYIIRNGKICEAVRGATLIGKGHEVLLNIDKVSDNLSLEEGMCGSVSGSVPTCVGQPTIRVSKLTVGGRQNG